MKLKELEDFNWFPAVLRKYQMELIGMLVSKFDLYKQVSVIIEKDLISHNIFKILDLCSGSGYPAVYIQNKINLSTVQTTLTDKFPQKLDESSGITYLGDAYDVNDLDPNSDTYYTMFNAFHHMDNIEQQKLIEKVLLKNSHLMIVEIIQPTLLNVLLVTLASTLGVLLLCLLIRPFEWKRFIFTYIIPINVFTVLTDGYISILKSKTKKSYQNEFATLFKVTSRIKIDSHFNFPAYLVTIKVSPENA